MPKFDPKQQQKKLRRHNPIAKASTGGGSSTASAQSQRRGNGRAAAQKLPDDAIPLLAHLPLPSSGTASAPSESSLEDDERRHRALLGLNPLLLSKSSRVALLAPHHQLLQRLLHHLDYPRLEVRKEAAGCLRNLCVNGKWTGREQIWKLGGGATALAQIEYAAGELGLLPRKAGVASTQQAAEDAGPAVAKKPDDMNRKERRQAAKAAAKASQAKTAIDAAQTMPAAATATPASAAAEADAHDLHLLHLSLLENHLTILWCLLESVSSPVWLISLNRSSLGELLVAAIARGAETFSSPTDSSIAKTDLKEQREIKAAQLEVSFTAANLLAAWLEDNPAGCAAIAGLPLELTEQVIAFEQAGNSSEPGTKSRKRLDAILDRFGGEMTTSKVESARRRIDTITSAVALLSNAALTTPADLERVNLALLALASSCNLLSPLPAAIRCCVPAPSKAPSDVQTLTQWHTKVASPLLLTFARENGGLDDLWQTADADAAEAIVAEDGKPEIEIQQAGDMDVDAQQTDGADEDEEGPAASMALRTAETLTLTVDLLGEICSESESEEVSVLPSPTHVNEDSMRTEGDIDINEDEDDLDGDDADSLTSEQEEEMLMLAEADRDGGDDDDVEGEGRDDVADADGDMSMTVTAATTTTQKDGIASSSTSKAKQRKIGFAANPYATLFADQGVASTLLDLLVKALPVAGAAPASTESTLPSVEFSVSVSNTLAALLSGLASHAHPPPTHPLEEGTRHERRVQQFMSWVSDQGERLSGTWTRLSSAAALVSSQPSLLPVSVPLWTSLHALVVCYEGIDADTPLPYAMSADSLQTFFGSSLDYYLGVSTSADSSTERRENATETTSLILSQLSYLSRVPVIGHPAAPSQLDRVAFSASTYLTLLLAIKTIPVKVTITVVNALIDTFSDEESDWDVPVFRNGQGVTVSGSAINGSILNVLKDPRSAIAVALKDRIRSVDARKSAELKALKGEAEETLDNFRAWLEFRESV